MFNGILVFNKPQGYTSHDIVAKLRGITRQKKIGHGGTLDPMATGVLPVFFGNATKACEYSVSTKKEYIASLRFGISTDTQDITGNVIKKSDKTVCESDINFALSKFKGDIEQLPPMYSALHKDGQRLYDLARKGIEVEREKRKITIFDLKLLSKKSENEYTIDVVCSKGTYIRTLCNDIGELLGCGATMTELKRVYTGGFYIDEAVGFEEVEEAVKNGSFQSLLVNTDKVFFDLPPVYVKGKAEIKIRNGVKTGEKQVMGEIPNECKFCRVYGENGEFIMVGKIETETAGERVISVEKMFSFNS